LSAPEAEAHREDVAPEDPAALRQARARLGRPALPLARGPARLLDTPRAAYRRWAARARAEGLRIEWRADGPGYVELTVGSGGISPAAGCLERRALLIAIPSAFDLPDAELDHASCAERGASACHYRLRWDEPRRRPPPWRGLVGGGALGLGLGLAASSGAPALGLLVLGLAWAGVATELALGQRRELDLRAWEQAGEAASLAAAAPAPAESGPPDEDGDDAMAELGEARAAIASLRGAVEIQRAQHAAALAHVAHDLGNALGPLVDPLDALIAGRETPEGWTRSLLRMRRTARRLQRRVAQIHGWARLEGEGVTPGLRLVEPARLLRELAEEFEAAAVERGRDLELLLQTPPLATGLDRAWIEAALANLIENALRYGDGRIELEASESADGIRLSVGDAGPGLPDEVRDRLERPVDRFALDGGPTARGLGLGLRIARAAAELHGGALRAERTGDRHAMVLLLPRHAARGWAELDEPEVSRARGASADLLSSARHRAAVVRPDTSLVLLVEDDDALRAHLTASLDGEFRVVAVASAEAALRVLADQRVDAVVCDVLLPGADGFSVCVAVKSDPARRTVPVLLLTAQHRRDWVARGFELGADDFVHKPVALPELVARLRVHLGLRRLLRDTADRERLAGLGVLAASVAHEVRNPLTVILAGLRLLAAGRGLSPDIAASMLEGGERIERLTADLLDLARVDHGPPVEYSPFEGLDRALRLFRAGRRDGPELRGAIDPALGRHAVRGRPGALSHAILNLLDNAVRAAGPDGVVELEAGARDDRLRIVVHDSGPGIAPEIRDSLFEPFVTTEPAGRGTGLGLSIVRGVVEQHGGDIEVDVGPHGGARFVLTLPLIRE
jgi:signal transduction histidine kinase